MNKQRFSAMLLTSAMALFIMSCGNNAEENKTENDSSSTTQATTNQTTNTTPASTIVTTPTEMMVVTHKVKDFGKWLPVYEGHDTARLASGIHNYVIGRGLTDTNMVLIALKIDDQKKAQDFGKSASLKQAMQKSGVIGAPSVKFNTMVYQDTATMSSPTLRSRTTFTVKDFDTWRNAFDSGRQIRKDNGVIDRAYGYETNNNKNVTVVVAISDSAKAAAYWKSDQLKQAMQRSGVIGQPQRFLYNIVKKY